MGHGVARKVHGSIIMKDSFPFCIILPGAILCMASGCSTSIPGDLPHKSYALAAHHNPEPLVNPASTNVVSFQEAILHALRTDADINELAARCHRAAGDLAGLHPESPEIRVGYEESRDNRRGWFSRQQSGRSTSSGEQLSTSSGSQTTEREQTSLTEFGDPADPDQTSIENSTTRETSRSSERETSRSRSTSSETTTGTDFQRQDEDGISVELRIRPPNPWLLSAERQTGKAAQTIAEAELLAREQELACDIVESGLRLYYQKRMLRLQSAFASRAEDVHGKLRSAFESSGLSAGDYADGCRLTANTITSQHRMEADVADLERDLLELTGVSPSRLELEALSGAAIFPFSLPNGQVADNDLAASLTAAHALVLRSQWTYRQMEAEWKEARAANIPWVSHLAAGYAWWEGGRDGYGNSLSSGSENRFTSSHSVENETETSFTESTEIESPSNDVTAREETARQSSASRTDSTERERELSNSTSKDRSHNENDGEEWWVEVGVNVPLFEWFSGQSGVRIKAARAAREAFDRVKHRVHSDILTALHSTRNTRDILDKSRTRFSSELPSLTQLASGARDQGLSGEVDALRIEESATEMAIQILDCSLREAVARIELVRSAGLTPSLDIPAASSSDLSKD